MPCSKGANDGPCTRQTYAEKCRRFVSLLLTVRFWTRCLLVQVDPPGVPVDDDSDDGIDYDAPEPIKYYVEEYPRLSPSQVSSGCWLISFSLSSHCSVRWRSLWVPVIWSMCPAAGGTWCWTWNRVWPWHKTFVQRKTLIGCSTTWSCQATKRCAGVALPCNDVLRRFLLILNDRWRQFDRIWLRNTTFNICISIANKPPINSLYPNCTIFFH